MKSIITKLLIPIMGIMLVSCEEGSIIQNNSDSKISLPTISNQKDIRTFNDEINSIKDNIHNLSWAYYRDINEQRWYISSKNNNKSDVYSLMPIKNNRAGWGTVGENVAFINIYNDDVQIDYISDNTDCIYYDVGWGENVKNCFIQQDIEKIRNSTVDIKWWFFQAPNNSWYITKENYNKVLKFALNDTRDNYGWQEIDIGIKPIFFEEDGIKKMKFESSNTPVFNLNAPADETNNFPKIGCNFSDISKQNPYYHYVTALCQSNIDLGTESSNYLKFEPSKLAKWSEIVKIANYSKDYNKMVYLCTDSKYKNSSKSQCHLDFAKSLNFNHSDDDLITIGETAKYIYKLFYNQTLSLDKAIDTLFKRGIIKIKDNNYISRGEMSKIILAEAGIYRLENNKDISKIRTVAMPQILPSLPYGLNPPTEDIPLVNIDLPSTDGDAIKVIDPFIIFSDENKCSDPLVLLFSGPGTCSTSNNIYPGFDREVILPSLAIEKPASIINDKPLPQRVVDTAIKSIGIKAPFIDKTHTHDLVFINSVIGLPTIHPTTQEFIDKYKENGVKTLEEANNGDIIVYKPEASTDGQPHITIKSNTNMEIGLPSVGGSVEETEIIKEQVDMVIPIENFNLPTLTDTRSEKISHTMTDITSNGLIDGELEAGDLHKFRIVGNENQNILLKVHSTSEGKYGTPIDIQIDDSITYDSNYIVKFGSRYLREGGELRFTLPKTGAYYISFKQQGDKIYHKETYRYTFNLSCDNGKSCPKVDDYDSIDNPRYLPMDGSTNSYNIDYKGDIDYYTLDIQKTGLVNIKIKSKLIDGNFEMSMLDIDNPKYKNMGGSMIRLRDNKSISWWLEPYLDKGEKYLIKVKNSSSSYDVEPYAIKISTRR